MHSPRGAMTKQERGQVEDQRRGTAASRGYDANWRRASRSHLSAHPLCTYCALEGRVRGASLTDHFYPPRVYGAELFWVAELWVSSCKPCHDGPKQAAERGGRVTLEALALRLGLPTLTDLRG